MFVSTNKKKSFLITSSLSQLGKVKKNDSENVKKFLHDYGRKLDEYFPTKADLKLKLLENLF